MIVAMPRRFAWAQWPERRLLETRLCDLGVRLRGTWVEGATVQLLRELEARDLRARPHFWVSTEWFSPEGVPGIAIPFFLLHPRLLRLERKMMLEVEGADRSECLKILRHESGHVLHHAFQLQRRKRWQRCFGASSAPYPDFYRPNPASRRYVMHLDYWYAQSHPDEDFAESFAVWLNPRSAWRRRYADWPALRKLEYVDELMADLAGRAPLVRSRAKLDPIEKQTLTLGEYYEQKRERYSSARSQVYDEDLQRFFHDAEEAPRGESAAAFLRRNRSRLVRMVARGTGSREFSLDAVLRDMIARCRELDLRVAGSRRELLIDFAILLTARSVRYLYRGREWQAL